MREAGATVELCPHCGKDTPVYPSSYGADGAPLSFSVCVWCEGIVEYGPDAATPHDPYAGAEAIRAAHEQKRRRRRERMAAARSGMGDPTRSRHVRTSGIRQVRL